MWGAIIPAAIGAAGSIAGGMLGSSANQSMAAQNLELQREAFQANMAWQREMATAGIQMRVKDAQAAGIHPLYALGTPLSQASPISLDTPHYDAGAGWRQAGNALQGMGQDISRAVLATQNRAERQKSILESERFHLENELLRANIAKTRSQIGPALPQIGGSPDGMAMPQGAPGNVAMGPHKLEAVEVQGSQPGQPSVAAGPGMTYVDFAHVGDGMRPVPPKNLKVEDEFGAPLMAQWIADVYANPQDYKPSQAQIEAKWGRGISRNEIIWDTARMMWRPYNMDDMRNPQMSPKWQGRRSLYDPWR